MPQNAGTSRGEALMKAGRQLAIIVAGSVLLIAGLVMLILPGPGILLILLGLALLAREFGWARRLLERARVVAGRHLGSLRKRKHGSHADASEDQA